LRQTLQSTHIAEDVALLQYLAGFKLFTMAYSLRNSLALTLSFGFEV